MAMTGTRRIRHRPRGSLVSVVDVGTTKIVCFIARVEDGDELRHGRTTIWARYGVAQGINAGDALCAISYLTLLHEEAVVQPLGASAAADQPRALVDALGDVALDTFPLLRRDQRPDLGVRVGRQSHR